MCRAGQKRSGDARGPRILLERLRCCRRRRCRAFSNPYEAALTTLDLVVSHLEEGNTAEVRILADEMVAVFREYNVPREALAGEVPGVSRRRGRKFGGSLFLRMVKYRNGVLLALVFDGGGGAPRGIEHDEPALFGGTFRIVLLRKG